AAHADAALHGRRAVHAAALAEGAWAQRMSSPVHPLAERYGNAPWVLLDHEGPNGGERWICRRHPGHQPFGRGISVDWFSTEGSHFVIGDCCTECVSALDDEVAERREW